jgi:F-type H+-transporting ATPase subunit a
VENKKKFLATDIIYLSLLALGPLFAIALKVLFTPQADDINIAGALIFFTVKLPFSDLPVTETQVNSLVVIWSIFWLCKYITHGISVRGGLKRQIIAEWIVEKTKSLVKGNMGEYFASFAPFVAAIMGLSAFSSLLTLIGLYPPTSDINTTAGWAILVFILITYYKFKCGPVHYLKSFGDPVPFLAPLNIISEFATPVSMAFRHYGNVLSGSVISVLVATALQGVSHLIFGKLPGMLANIPFLQIGLPAVLSVYFDLFSGLLQAFIFAMLTMLYVSGGFPAEDYAAKKAARDLKRAAKQNSN